MEAPECAVCGVEVEPHADARVRFADHPGVTDHVGAPDGAGWFCEEHRTGALERTNMTLAAAVAELRVDPGIAALRVRARDFRLRYYDCAPIALGRLTELMVAHASAILRPLGLTPPPLAKSSRRDWSPMDRVMPPNCPYSDRLWHEGRDGGVHLRISVDRNHWSDDELANGSVSFAVWAEPDGRRLFSVGGSDHDCVGRAATVRRLHTAEPVSTAQDAAIRVLLATIELEIATAP